jgi:hypothetical protein
MSSGPTGDLQVSVSCPRCGQTGSISAEATLHPSVCANCQQLHVATLTTGPAKGKSSDTSIDMQIVLPEGVNNSLGEIGRYVVTRVLGTGAFGVVYQAWDPSLRIWVAIKVPTFRQRKETAVESFLREARAAAQLRHPCIVGIFNADQQDGQPYIVSEYVAGGTLAAHLKSGPIPLRKGLRIIRDLATALHYAHRQGVVHRDIKPANIMIDAEGRPRLMDFGLALQSNDAPDTEDGALVGTPAYMSPEQARGEHELVGPGSDQYSLGVILFECLAGRRPREGAVPAMLRQIAKEQAPPVRQYAPKIPAALARICDRMLAQAIPDRYADMNEVAVELAMWLKQKPTSTTPAPAGFSRRLLWGIGLGTAGVATVTILIAALLQSSRPAEESGASLGPSPAVDPATINPAPPQTPEPTPAVAVPPSPIPVQQPVPALAFTAPAMAQNDDPPVDALDVVLSAGAGEADTLVDLKPTYPPVLLTADQRQLLHELLILGLPKRSRELAAAEIVSKQPQPASNKRPERVDDQAFQKVLELQRQLSSAAATDPRVPLAVALIRKRYNASPSVNKSKIPEAYALFEEARKNQTSFCAQAYMSLVDHWLTGSEKDQAKAQQEALKLMLEAAQRLRTSSDWPDAAERRRVAVWLGRIQGFYASGIGKKAAREQFFVLQQDALTAALPENLRTIFEASFIDTQLQIADEVAESDAKLSAQIKQSVADSEQKIVENIERQGVLAGQKEALQGATAELLQRLQKREAEILKEGDSLLQNSRGLQIQMGVVSADLSAAQLRQSNARNELVNLQNAVGMGTQVDPAQFTFANNELIKATELVVTQGNELQRLFEQNQLLQRRAAILEQELRGLSRTAKQAKVKFERQTRDLDKELKDLDQGIGKQVAKSGTVKADEKNRQKDLARFERWAQWSEEEAERWLIDSLSRAAAPRPGEPAVRD